MVIYTINTVNLSHHLHVLLLLLYLSANLLECVTETFTAESSTRLEQLFHLSDVISAFFLA